MSPHPTPGDLVDLVDALLARPAPAPIVTAGDPVLRTPAIPYDGQLDGERFHGLIRLMRATMNQAPGVGLAAPQIGVPLRLAVMEDPARVRPGTTEEALRARERGPQPFRVLVNPRYEAMGARLAAFYEGCLSVPGWQAVTARHHTVRLTGQDETGRELDEEVRGWPARIVQHETDHLGGTLYLDRAEIRSLAADRHVLERWSAPVPGPAADALGFPLPGR
ncbi:peptide deformylase [Amycolatopsis cynarae]|uniref:Peptide deformylase n=1 Tax=Amycolatopsis cynarae TaxID=2995223 RepID=A0ABY7BAF0_9PSEU|nr:peptide deformylase [Amycolatopsis sp. HUAS 11-8]WAL69345.1 peptide deformylase [Amycolatopsis sp. HUAS 11-8]